MLKRVFKGRKLKLSDLKIGRSDDLQMIINKSSEKAERSATVITDLRNCVNMISWKLLFRQFLALTRKNAQLRYHALWANILQLLQAAVFVFMIWLVNWAITNSNDRLQSIGDTLHPKPKDVGSIPDCEDDLFLRKDKPCYTLLYSPHDDPVVAMIVNNIVQNNEPPIPDHHIRGFSNTTEVDEFLLEYQESVLAAVHFLHTQDKKMDYVIQTNTSVRFFKGQFRDPNFFVQLPLQKAVEREVVKYITNDPGMEWNVSFTHFAHPQRQENDIISAVTPVFLVASSMFSFVTLLFQLVSEKETGVLQALRNMGLKDSAFWSSWLLSEVLVSALHTAVVVITASFLKIPLFVNNSLFLVAMLVFMTNLSLMSIAFLVSGILNKADSAVPVGFGIFVAAWIMQMCIQSGFPYDSAFSSATRIPFNIFPWTLLAKACRDLAEASVLSVDGISWSHRGAYCWTDQPPPSLFDGRRYLQLECVLSIDDALQYLAMQLLCYFILAVYVNNVMPNIYGVRKPFYYFLLPSYWWPSTKHNIKNLKWAAIQPVEESYGLKIDADVRRERDKMRLRCKKLIKQAEPRYAEGSEDSESSTTSAESELTKKLKAGPRGQQRGEPDLELFNLRKKYRSFTAVEGTWLGVNESECFCLLGPNGAGKTTTINCLTGVLPPSGGDALVYGESILTPKGMDSIRSIMGVCPQFDILYDNLTGREHLKLFADVKGIPRGEIKKEISNLLEQVKLTEAADLISVAYSGGMRRRLSVAIALLGNPKIVYLDEPTTGMDPISRRHVWDLIDTAKKGRIIVLTTHSMEEADMLGDRIGIMARGRLRCLGNGLRLKARFGSGYKMSISIKDRKSNSGQVKQLLKDALKVDTYDESEAYLHFLVPSNREDQMGKVIRELNTRKKEMNIQDIQLSLTPLEEVFLNVARQAELEYARNNAQFEVLTIAEEKNAVIKVPLGAETAVSASGTRYILRWGQNERGALKLMDYCPASLARKTSWVTSSQLEGI